MRSLESYKDIVKRIEGLDDNEKKGVLRYLSRTDLFFLGWFICKRDDLFHPWVLDRCQEIEQEPDNHIDLWAREHYKSTLITFLKTLQDILISHGEGAKPVGGQLFPSFAIFSFTRPIAKAFLRQIKNEVERNVLLKSLFPDILWENPKKDSPKWSEDDGLIFKRKTNQKESTIEAWGVVDGQPTSKHFNVMIYDDLVTIDSVRSEMMIHKVMEAWQLSTNLGADHGVKRIIGTRYHYNDPYSQLIEDDIMPLRKYAATDDGTRFGKGVLLSDEKLKIKLKEMGQYVFSTQMLLDPVHDSKMSFKFDWLNFYENNSIPYNDLNVYILVDPANSKAKDSDYTAMAVIGLGEDDNYYVLHFLRDRLNINERIGVLFDLHRKYKPLSVGYERYGMQTDIDLIMEEQKRINYRFKVIELSGKVSKKERILKLGAICESERFILPESCNYVTVENKQKEMVDEFIHQEYMKFPYGAHDDLLDACARILDPQMETKWPSKTRRAKINAYHNRRKAKRGSAWSV